MSDDYKPGDNVSWQYSGSTVEGKVEKKLTEPTKIKGHDVKASADNPEYLVKSKSTGAEAAHKPDALSKD